MPTCWASPDLESHPCVCIDELGSFAEINLGLCACPVAWYFWGFLYCRLISSRAIEMNICTLRHLCSSLCVEIRDNAWFVALRTRHSCPLCKCVAIVSSLRAALIRYLNLPTWQYLRTESRLWWQLRLLFICAAILQLCDIGWPYSEIVRT